MNKTVLIYAIVRLETGDAYVGSTISRSTRWASHRRDLSRGTHHCVHLCNAWRKYGPDAFEFMELEWVECETRDERYLAELTWIKAIGTYNHMVLDERSGTFTLSQDRRDERRLQTLKRMEARPAYRAFLAKRGEALATFMQSPEGRAAMARHTERRWQDPAECERLAKGLENRWADPTARARQAEKTGNRMRSGDAAAKHSEKMKAAWQDPEKSAKLKARLAARWADPEAKARHSERMKRQWAARRATKASSS